MSSSSCSRTTTPTTCQGCQQEFPSRNAVFKHLKDTRAVCLAPGEAYDDFCRHVLDNQDEKVLLLFGYLTNISSSEYSCEHSDEHSSDDRAVKVANGTDAANLILDAIASLTTTSSTTSTDEPQQQQQQQRPKYLRSYGRTARNTNLLAQDDYTGAIMEVLSVKLPVVGRDTIPQWMDQVNAALCQTLKQQHSDAMIRVLGRQTTPGGSFNAEYDLTHRRIEYLLPMDFLFADTNNTSNNDDNIENFTKSLDSFFRAFPGFYDGISSREEQQHNAKKSTSLADQPMTTTSYPRPDPKALTYLYRFKKIMQSLTTHVVELDFKDETAVREKKIHETRRFNDRKRGSMNRREAQQPSQGGLQGTDPQPHVNEKKSEKTTKQKQKHKGKGKGKKTRSSHVLQRKRYHNFTPSVMAHEYLSYRRLDRFYHRATIHLGPDQMRRPYMVLSMTGDLFLTGQVLRLVGLMIALMRGVVDPEFVECVFDENYAHLVPTLPAPTRGMYASEAYYCTWEGKGKTILTPRKCDRYSQGWNDEETLQRVKDWQTCLRQQIAKRWILEGIDGMDSEGRLCAEREWSKRVLMPWATKANQQLQDYREWKRAKQTKCLINPLPVTDSIRDESVPLVYETVLRLLREADRSGKWPMTTQKRQLVMVSSLHQDAKQAHDGKSPDKTLATSLAVAIHQTKSNQDPRLSAYDFQEGQGGASGSFSVGAMPGEQCSQPKANETFRELMKAAFELEIALCPNRMPSSTIAINRNAQFRPHTDSGSGSGQSTSLIVGLGAFSGGELMVEGEKKDIRYKPVEFDGWKQRHWTLPFQGERYSLVWFTPKGCEGVCGIDL